MCCTDLRLRLVKLPNQDRPSIRKERGGVGDANRYAPQPMKWIAIILMCVATCVVYGIIHDQITARICVEYFTIGHAPVFGTDDPTLLGLGWGVIATWWVGVLLGIPLAVACRLGRWPKREPLTLWRPLIRLSIISFGIAILAGLVGWIAASNGWVVLVGPIAERVPPDRRVPFLIDLWAHSASYLVGFVGGVVLIVFVLIARQREHLRSGT